MSMPNRAVIPSPSTPQPSGVGGSLGDTPSRGSNVEETQVEEKKITIEEARRLLNRVKDGENIPREEVALALKATGDIT